MLSYESLIEIAEIADERLWNCRNRFYDGCLDSARPCGDCRMVAALHSVGLGDGLVPGDPCLVADREEMEGLDA